jgi:hypothetical protein
MRKALKITGYVLATIVTLLVACSIAVQTPKVQTFIAHKFVNSLKDRFGGDIKFDMVQLKPFTALVLKNVAIIDRHPYSHHDITDFHAQDTIFRAGYVVANFSLKGLLSKDGVYINRAYVRDGMFLLTNEPSGSNLKRFINSHNKNQGKSKLVFDIKDVELRNFRYKMLNYKRLISDAQEGLALKPYGIRWDDMDIMDINLKGRKLHYASGVMSGIADDLSFNEKSGYVCRHISGRVKVGNGRTLIKNLILKDKWSNLSLPTFKMNYHHTADFSDFINAVKLTADVNKSQLNFKSLSYFAPALKDKILDMELSGHVHGYVNDLNLKNLHFHERGSSISGIIDGRLSGLPHVQTLITNFRVNNLAFTTQGLTKFLKVWSPSMKLDMGKYAPEQTLSFSGTGLGPLNRLALKGKITSVIGSIATDLDLRNIIDKKRDILISGAISTNDLNIEKIIGKGPVHECTIKTSLHAELQKGGPNVKIDSLIVQRANILGYDYSNIAAAGTYSNNAFNGKIISNDPNLNFMFQGIFTLSNSSKNAKYVFYANLGYADLKALNIDKRGVSRVAMELNADYTRISKGDILGNFDINNLVLENNQGVHKIGNISVSSHSNDNLNRIKFASSFADGTYVGSKPIGNLFKDAENILLKKELPALFKDPTFKIEGDNYDLSVNFHDTRDLLSYVMPGLYIADSTAVRFKIGKDGSAAGSVSSHRIAFGNKYMKGVDFQVDNNDGSINGKLNSAQTNISTLEFKNNTIVIYADHNEIGVGLTYDNQTELSNKGEIYLTGNIARDRSDSLVCNASLLSSNVYYENDAWTINPSKLLIHGSNIKVDNFSATCNDQSLQIRGGISKDKRDTLAINLVKFNIGLINSLISQNLSISGLATGKALITSKPGSQRGILANLTCDSTLVAGKRAGMVKMASSWDNQDNKFDIFLSNELDGRSTINAKAAYYPESNSIRATATLEGMDIAYAGPLLSSIFSGTDGCIWGEIHAEGPLDKLMISSSGTRFDNAIFKVAFTNVAYMANGPFHLTQEGLFFDNIVIKDRSGGSGTINGGIAFNGFKNIEMDTHIHVTDMECLNTTIKDNPSFYGSVYASGDVGITGPLHSLLLDIKASTTKAGTFHIPLASASKATSSNLLTFYEHEKTVYVDPYDLMMHKAKAQAASKNDMRVKLQINATPKLEGLVELDKDAGNVLSTFGFGNIALDIRPSREVFDINGDYNITTGSFHFVALGIAKKDFALKEGSNIKFNGNIMDSDLNVKGVYTTKTSLATLIADTSSVSTRKTVECGIGISDKLKNPRLEFSIDVQDVDPTTKSRVESALNTEDKIQKQFISLLVSNRFLPGDESGVVNTSNMLYSNVAEIMSNQLNNIFEKLDIPLDLGLSYQSNEKGNDIFDVALSTQLFNNRVIVNGTLGNRQFNTSESNEDVVGDLDIEVKLDKPGRLRLNLFSHSADAYTIYLDNTQRNGIGIGYQQDFNSFGEFFGNLFSSKSKKEKKALEQVGKKEDQVMIHIDPPNKNK